MKDILPRRPRYHISASRDEELRNVVQAVKTHATNVRSAVIKGDYLQWLTSARGYVEWVIWVSRRYALWGYEDKVKGFTTCSEVFSWLDDIQTKWTARISKETYDIARQRYNASLPIGTVSPPSTPTRATNRDNNAPSFPTTPSTHPSSTKKTPEGPNKVHRRHSSTPGTTVPEKPKSTAKPVSKDKPPQRRSTHPVIPSPSPPTTTPSKKEPPKPTHENLSRRKSKMVLRMPGYRVVSEMDEDNEVLVLRLRE